MSDTRSASPARTVASVEGLKLGDYEVLSRLAAGGMSEILLGFRRGFGGFRKLVVLKQILPDIRGQDDFVRMFLDEARVMGALSHPHIAQVFDLALSDNQLFLAMEFVPGATLAELSGTCTRLKEPMPLGFTLMAVRDTARALHAAHTFSDPSGKAVSIIHRDVTHKNVMVTYDGVTKLLDFGIARLPQGGGTAHGTLKGTTGYLAPEQLQGLPLDPRADVFSLGVVLHECLTGVRLFASGKGTRETLRASLEQVVPPPSHANPDVPPELDAVALKALQRNRDARFGSALEMAQALEQAGAGKIWAPEQAGPWVDRLYKGRRERTHQLLADFSLSSMPLPKVREALVHHTPILTERPATSALWEGEVPTTKMERKAATRPVAEQDTVPGVAMADLRRTAQGKTRPGNAITQPGEPERPRGKGRDWALAGASALKPGLTIGGCKLVTRIGVGSTGTVWLARQLSLDRNVAVKILRPHLGQDLGFVVQFTREALAAAQLVHHNIVQIYDSGTESGLHYFSMEYVEGEALPEVLKREGKLAPEVAAGYALQAARGLKAAHERGLIHRDVKPENLLINRDGIVKVADLGLVKHAGEDDVTPRPGLDGSFPQGLLKEGIAVGTPAFMAPEQANGSVGVDARADIYSLGCTLYNLMTGRPPFSGDSVAAVVSQHFFTPPEPPEKLAPRVPPALSEMTLKMMAKGPNDRYQSAAEVISALEGFLGVDGSATFSPREEHAQLLESSVHDYNGAPWAFRGRLVAASFFALTVGLAGTAVWLRLFPWAVAVASVGVIATSVSLFANAFASRSSLLLKLRHWVTGAGWVRWVVGLSLLAGGVGTLWWFDLLLPALELFGVGVGLALGLFALVDRRALQQRRAPLEAVEQMLRGMRLRGLEETALRQFVCRYSGRDWEPFYEALFGYDAKLQARARWGHDDKGLPRKRRGLWRDPLLRWVDRRLEARQRAKDTRHLAALEASAPAPEQHEKPTAPIRSERPR